MKRYYVIQGSPNADGDNEWIVLDRQHRPCGPYCDGGVVMVATTRRAAREECGLRNAETADCQK